MNEGNVQSQSPTRPAATAKVKVSTNTHIVDGHDPVLWQDLARHASASLFFSRPWMEAVAATYGFNVSASAVRAACGRCQAAMVFSHVTDLRGERVVSFPFSDYCDPYVDDLETWRELIAPLLARGVPITVRCLNCSTVSLDKRFRLVGRAAWHGVDLTSPEDSLWAGLGAGARTRIRKALGAGLSVRAGNRREDVGEFYAMHCQVRKSKYRMLPQPIALFEQLHARFSPDNRLTVLLAERDGEPVAGVFLLEYEKTLYYKYAASVDRSASPNDLLIWEAIVLGQQRNLERLDLGASDLDQPGLLRFKRKYATEEREIKRFRWEPPGYADARAEQAERILGSITQLLTDPAVPDDITRAAGDTLYAHFC